MEDINFDRNKAIKSEIYQALLNLIYLNVFFAGFYFVFSSIIFWFWVVIGGFFITYTVFKIFYYNIVLKNLKYYMSDSILVKKYRFITNTTDTARLQIVNSVDMKQRIVDRILNIFNVNISYGMGEEGYSFFFNHLDEKTAEHIMKKIKPSGFGVQIK